MGCNDPVRMQLSLMSRLVLLDAETGKKKKKSLGYILIAIDLGGSRCSNDVIKHSLSLHTALSSSI